MSGRATASTSICGRIVFLNGVPNAGKTTLADALQASLDEPYWHLSLDEFLRGYDDRHWLGANPPSFIQVMNGYLRSLRQLALCGNNIVAEAVITSNRLKLYLDLFGDLPVLLIGLHVPLAEAQRRERGRTGRIHGPYQVTEVDVEEVPAQFLSGGAWSRDSASPNEERGAVRRYQHQPG